MLYQRKNVHGGDLYGRNIRLDFSSNTNPLGTPESVRRAVIRSAGNLSQYPDPCCRTLVSALAEFEQVPEDYILCGCGAAELIFSYCAAARPQRALELAPTFSEYAAALEAAGCRTERYPLSPEDGFALGPDFLDFLQRGHWDALFLCNPNNPTGRTVPPSLLGEISDICRERGMRLFVDECFLDLSDGGRALSLKDRLCSDPGLFLLKAFTKSYGMAGLRLGYCLSTDSALLSAMSRAVQPWNVSLPAQAAGVAALEDRSFLARAQAVIRTERQWLAEQLEALCVTHCPSQANYLLFYSPLPLCDELLQRGILIRDCASFPGLGPGWCRIAVKRREENEVLIDALRMILEKP